MRTRRSLAAASMAICVAVIGFAGPVGAGAPGVADGASAGRPASGTVAVDETFDVTCRRFGEPVGTAVVRITATVPAELTSGATFTVPDLAVEASAEGQPLIRPEGTDQSFVTPDTAMVVVAPPGEAVVLRFESFVVIVAGRPYATCFPDRDGTLATIPVVA